MLGHLTAVGILQIAVGGAELLFVGGWILIVIWSASMAHAQPDGVFMLIGYSVFGFLALASAVMRLVSGISSFYFKYRTLSIVSLIYGLLMVITCYCSVPAVAVGIYGLIVFFHPAVKRFYSLRRTGMSAAEIRNLV